MKRIVCLGGGPAGLYAAILLRKALPHARVEVYERNRPGRHLRLGRGVLRPDHGELPRAPTRESHAAILASFHHWDDIAIHFGGRAVRERRPRLLRHRPQAPAGLLQERARELGVQQVFQHEVEDESAFADADLIIAADGVNSRTRARHSGVFEPDIDVRKCRFIWLGTTQHVRGIHVCLRAHRARLVPDPCVPVQRGPLDGHRRDPRGNLAAHGLDEFDTTEQSIAFCERLFARYLDGHRLQSNAGHLRGSAWLNFNRVCCKRWHHGKLVLIGDAAHTAHFSIGSGHQARHGRCHLA